MYACICIPNAPASARPELLRWAESFSPLIEPGPDRVLLDLRGMGTLMGRPREIAARMSSALLEAGLEANIAIASNPHSAVAAARGIEGTTVIAPGDEPRALARLPLSLLDPDPELFDTLASWGIHTFGDLSRLPETGLAERLGPEGVRLHRLASGYSPGPLVPAQEAPKFESDMDLDHPLDSLEPLAFILGRLLNEICGKLVSRGLAATEISLHLDLDDRTEHERSVRLPYATTDNGSLLKLLQYDLAAHPPHASILRVQLRAEPAPQRRLQSGLFVPVAPEAEKLELTLARLAVVAGEGNVGSPELLNAHRPDAFRMNRFIARADKPPAGAPAPLHSPLAMRVYRPPVPAQVAAPLGPPQRIVARGITGAVIGYAGPWRTSGDWWTSDPWDREEWDVALDSGAICRLVRLIPTAPPEAKPYSELPGPVTEPYGCPAPAPEVIAPALETASERKTAAAVADASVEPEEQKQVLVRTGWFIHGIYD